MRLNHFISMPWTPRLRPQAYPRTTAFVKDAVGAAGAVARIVQEADT